ncbi:MAG: peptidylprolyl isomerase [Acidobacteriota bacterium]
MLQNSKVLMTVLVLGGLTGCGGSTEEVSQPATPPEVAEPDTPKPEPAAIKGSGSETPADSQPEAVAKETVKADERATTEKSKPTAGKADAKAGPPPGLLDPSKAKLTAPSQFRVKFETTKGNFLVEVNRSWAPLGADRFFNLVKIGFFDDVAFFRVIKGFIVQFGLNGNPRVSAAWKSAPIQDDPVKESNKRGSLSFAAAGDNTRTTQIFINYRDNVRLDSMGFASFGKVVEGMDVVDALYAEYGEGSPRGGGPSQGGIQSQGNRYLKSQFPKLDYIKRARIIR